MVCDDVENQDVSQKKEVMNQDVLSTSSLRRKLFFHPDNSSFAISPVKLVLRKKTNHSVLNEMAKI